jgi:hypothetical protein
VEVLLLELVLVVAEVPVQVAATGLDPMGATVATEYKVL